MRRDRGKGRLLWRGGDGTREKVVRSPTNRTSREGIIFRRFPGVRRRTRRVGLVGRGRGRAMNGEKINDTMVFLIHLHSCASFGDIIQPAVWDPMRCLPSLETAFDFSFVRLINYRNAIERRRRKSEGRFDGLVGEEAPHALSHSLRLLFSIASKCRRHTRSVAVRRHPVPMTSFSGMWEDGGADNK